MIGFPISLNSQVKIDLNKKIITIDKNAKAKVKNEAISTTFAFICFDNQRIDRCCIQQSILFTWSANWIFKVPNFSGSNTSQSPLIALFFRHSSIATANFKGVTKGLLSAVKRFLKRKSPFIPRNGVSAL